MVGWLNGWIKVGCSHRSGFLSRVAFLQVLLQVLLGHGAVDRTDSDYRPGSSPTQTDQNQDSLLGVQWTRDPPAATDPLLLKQETRHSFNDITADQRHRSR